MTREVYAPVDGCLGLMKLREALRSDPQPTAWAASHSNTCKPRSLRPPRPRHRCSARSGCRRSRCPRCRTWLTVATRKKTKPLLVNTTLFLGHTEMVLASLETSGHNNQNGLAQHANQLNRADGLVLIRRQKTPLSSFRRAAAGKPTY